MTYCHLLNLSQLLNTFKCPFILSLTLCMIPVILDGWLLGAPMGSEKSQWRQRGCLARTAHSECAWVVS